MSGQSVSLGPIIYTAVKPIFKIYFVIGSGFWLGKKNILTVDTVRNLSDIVVTLILPCLMFQKIVVNLQSSDIEQIGMIILFSILLLLVGGAGALLSFALGKPKHWFGGCLCVGMMSNISDLPIAYLQTLASGLVFTPEQGEKGAAYICIYTAFQTFCLFNLGMVRFIGSDFDKQKKEESLKDADIEIGGAMSHASKCSSKGKKKPIAEYSNNAKLTTSDKGDDETDSLNEKNEENLKINIVQLTRKGSNKSVSGQVSKLSTASLQKTKSHNIKDVIEEHSQAVSLNNKNLMTGQGEFTEVKIKENPRPSDFSLKGFGLFILENMKRPLSLTLLLAITIAMIPWARALFVVSTQTTIHPAPDKLPPLSFIMDYVGYLANACIPTSLLILGSTLSRLSIGEMPKGFWIAPLSLTIFRLVIQPIIGVCIVIGFDKAHWFENDDMLKFVSTLVWCLPNATSLIYITAFYGPVKDHEKFHQMDYLALTYMFEYPLLIISLPFLATFTIKVLLDI